MNSLSDLRCVLGSSCPGSCQGIVARRTWATFKNLSLFKFLTWLNMPSFKVTDSMLEQYGESSWWRRVCASGIAFFFPGYWKEYFADVCQNWPNSWKISVNTVCFMPILKMYEGGRHEQEEWLVKQCKCNGKAAHKNCRYMEIHLPGGLGAGRRDCRK